MGDCMKLSEIAENPRLKLLAYGDSGVGKTCFAATFPGPNFIFDFDGKVSSAATFLANDKEQLGSVETESYLKVGPNDLPFNRFYTKLCELEKQVESGTFAYKTIVLDSITLFYDRLMDEIMRQQAAQKRINVAGTLIPILSDYNAAQHHFKNMVLRLLALPCHVVMTAHIKTTQDENTGEIIREPLVTGKNLGPWLPVVFEEVYRVYTERDVKGTQYLAQTQKDAKFVARSQITGLPNPVKLDFKTILGFKKGLKNG